MNRRTFASHVTTAVGAGAVAACGGSQADDNRTTYILVHGGWASAGQFEQVASTLAANGHRVIARDLPGHGLSAKFPASFWARPFDAAAFATEVSPLAAISLQDYVTQVQGLVDSANASGASRVVLVGHSMAGIVLNAVGEVMGPSRITRLVYLSALMTPSGTTASALTQSALQAGSAINSLFASDPATTGCLRIDFRTPTGAALDQVLKPYLDMPVDRARAAINMLSCDDPIQPYSATTTLTAAKWGAIPRTYVKCTQDLVFLPASQDYVVQTADAFTPTNPTRVVSLDAGHFAHISKPDQVAALLMA